MYHLYDSYYYLLNSLSILSENNIFPLDINDKNIIFDNLLKPKIINFELCLNECSTNEYLMLILDKYSNYSLKPIEIHFLFYLCKNDILHITSDFVSEVVYNFTNNVPFFDLFSSNYKKQYEQESIAFLNNFINKPIKYVIDNLFVFKETWGNYSLSILYLYLIGNTIKIFGLF